MVGTILITLALTLFLSCTVWELVGGPQCNRSLFPSRDEAHAVWVRAAHQVSTTVDPLLTTSTGSSHLRFVVDGQEVRVRHNVGHIGGRSTVVAVEMQSTPGLRMAIHNKRSSFFDNDWLGLRKVYTNDAFFSAKFVSRANNSDFGAAWLNPRVRASLAATQSYAFSLEGSHVSAVFRGLEDDQKELELAIRAAVDLAQGGRDLLATWQQMAGELGGRVLSLIDSWAPNGLAVIRLERLGVKVRIDATKSNPSDGSDESRLWTVVRTELTRPSGLRLAACTQTWPSTVPDWSKMDGGLSSGFFKHFQVRSPVPERVRKHLGRRLQRQMVDLNPWSLSVDQESVTLVFKGLVLDVDRLERAIDVAASFGRVSVAGPYR